MAGTHVCLRRVEAAAVFDAIRAHRVTHYCGAPIVHSMLVNAPDDMKRGIGHRVSAMVAAAAPPASMIEGMDRLGFDLTHVYGLTEVYGPATVCAKQPDWAALDVGERAMLNGRQGVRYTLEEGVAVLDPDTLQPVPWDGETIGEVMFRGNITMKGYLKNEKATHEAFRGGWFHSGDLAVVQPDGYLRIKDRSKDIIISGGENISSIEVEDALFRHPAVIAAAVVAQPDPKWGEVPCAFVELEGGRRIDGRGVAGALPPVPAGVQDAEEDRVRRTAEDLDREDPEVHAAAAGEVRLGHRCLAEGVDHECSGSPPIADPYVLNERDDRGVVTLTLNRPQQFNALSEEMLSALQSELEAVAGDAGARVVVIAGKGKAFCPGHDLKQMKANPSIDYYRQLVCSVRAADADASSACRSR